MYNDAVQPEVHSIYRNAARGHRVTAIGNIHKTGKFIILVVPDICSQTDTQTDTLITILNR